MNTELLEHGIMFGTLTTGEKHHPVPVAVGIFTHHRDGYLARIAVGYTREAAVSNLSNPHNPTEIIHDIEELRSFTTEHGIDLNDPVSLLPEFTARVEKLFQET